MRPARVVIAGCGFLGEAAAGFFFDAGWQVLGLSATQQSVARLVSSCPFEVRAADITGDLSGIPDHWIEPDVLIHCASSGRRSVDAYRAIYRDGLINLIQSFRPARVIFTSSTSVYAQTDGSWVDESSPTCPFRETSIVLLEAEKIALQAKGSIARISGIYGPGRSAFLRKFLTGEAVGDVRWINQIHRDDAAHALVRIADLSVTPGIYNICDNTPATQEDIYSWIAAVLLNQKNHGQADDLVNSFAAKLINFPHQRTEGLKALPSEESGDLHRKRGWTNKRVSNTKLRATGWQPDFSSYADAAPALLYQVLRHEKMTLQPPSEFSQHG